MAPESASVPIIRYQPVATASDATPNTLVLREPLGRLIHLSDFGVRLAGLDGQGRCPVAVELLDAERQHP